MGTCDRGTTETERSMTRLIHLIYSSGAATPFSNDDLLELLSKARQKNANLHVTGMLLHIDGSFLQVIEGQPEVIDTLFGTISADPRHTDIVTIIREAIPKRSFSDWSMGFADISRADLEEMEGVSDYLISSDEASSIAPGRAKKLLSAFSDGRWRTKSVAGVREEKAQKAEMVEPSAVGLEGVHIAFQPIISVSQGAIWAHEAMAWDNKTQREVASCDQPIELLAKIEEDTWHRALEITARPDLSRSINVNLLPADAPSAVTQMEAIIDIASRQNIDSRMITLELNQDFLSGDLASVISIVQKCKESGLAICLDHFGAGRSGLNQLEMSQPNSIALNEKLVRGIDTNGAKQAIVRGLMQTCDDLAIDVIAKHVETMGEFEWLAGEGIDLFQGGLIGRPKLHEPGETAQIPPLK